MFLKNLGKKVSGNKNAFFSLFSDAVGFSEDYSVILSGYLDKQESYGQVMGKFLCSIKFGLKYRNRCLGKIASIYIKYFQKLIIFKFYRRKYF